MRGKHQKSPEHSKLPVKKWCLMSCPDSDKARRLVSTVKAELDVPLGKAPSTIEKSSLAKKDEEHPKPSKTMKNSNITQHASIYPVVQAKGFRLFRGFQGSRVLVLHHSQT